MTIGAALLIAVILLIVVLVALFYAPPQFGMGLKIFAAICALVLFLAYIGAIHL